MQVEAIAATRWGVGLRADNTVWAVYWWLALLCTRLQCVAGCAGHSMVVCRGRRCKVGGMVAPLWAWSAVGGRGWEGVGQAVGAGGNVANLGMRGKRRLLGRVRGEGRGVRRRRARKQRS